VLIQPVDIFVHAWLIIAALSAAYVAWDQFTGNPEPVVMKWGFVLVTLYMGPIGLLLYVMADKEPAPGGSPATPPESSWLQWSRRWSGCRCGPT